MSTPSLTKAAVYSTHPSIAHVQAIVDNLPKTTGRSIQDWVALMAAAGPTAATERKAWLIKAHKLSGTTAGTIADWAAEGGFRYEPEAHVEAMYAGAKAGLRPLYDDLLRLGLGLGADVKACPCKTFVPLYRRHVFAQIKPSTRTRIDLGLWLPQTDGVERLIPTGGLEKGDRITYRMTVSATTDIDDELRRWLRIAYEREV